MAEQVVLSYLLPPDGDLPYHGVPQMQNKITILICKICKMGMAIR